MSNIKPELLGLTAINPFAPNNSSPRMVMLFNHFSQRPSLATPESRIVKSGAEYELAKYIDDVKTEHDVVVKDICHYIPELSSELNPLSYMIVEYEKETPEGVKFVVDYIELPSYKNNHTHFGYSLKRDYNSISNTYIPKDTVLCRSNSLLEDGSYGYGLNANVAFLSIPEVSEDGYVISESFARRAGLEVIEKRTIILEDKQVLLNLYGDKDHYKCFPDIGEKVREDGLLFAARKIEDVVDLSDENLKFFDPVFDRGLFVKPNSEVIDIRVIPGTKRTEYPESTTEQLELYSKKLLQFNKSFIEKVTRVYNERKRIAGEDNVEYSPRLHRRITDLMMIVDAATKGKTKLQYKKMNIDYYKIDITTRVILIPDNGFKLTCTHGGKGVVCKVLPDHLMPRDEFGNVADVITDRSSTISRMNIGRLYEAYLGATARDNRKRLVQFIEKKYGIRLPLQNITDILHEEDINYIRDYMVELHSHINAKISQFIASMSREEIINYIQEVLNHAIFIYYPVDNEKNIAEVVKSLESSRFRPHIGHITMFDEHGQPVISKQEIRIGNFYVMMLEKIADSFMATASARVNNYSIPVKSSQYDKHTSQCPNNPTKTLGETEVRIFNSYMSEKANRELIDMNLNPNTHKEIVKNILEADHPMHQVAPVDRQHIPYGNSVVSLMLKNIFGAYGVDFVKIDENMNVDVDL